MNYDGLTHAGLLLHGSPADLADGRPSFADFHRVVVGHRRIQGHRIRVEDNFPPHFSPLLQLHGSLGWLRSPKGKLWRFSLDDLRDLDYWTALGNGTTNWTPVVVLTDQKERTIVRRPFALAYDIFQQRLVSSDRWLIAGYGFGDEPVNEIFRTAWKTRMRASLPQPEILVVDYKLANPRAQRVKVGKLLGIPTRQILVSNTGVPAVINDPDWTSWAA